MKRAHMMFAAVATVGVLAVAWTAGAQQSAPTEIKVQRTDRNFIRKAAEVGRKKSTSASSPRARLPATRSSGSLSAWWRTTARPTRS